MKRFKVIKRKLNSEFAKLTTNNIEAKEQYEYLLTLMINQC